MELKLSDLIIFESMKGYKGYSNQYPNDPLIFVSKWVCSISSFTQKVLDITKDSTIVFSTKNDVTYMAVLPLDSKIKGYKAQYHPKTKNVYISCKSSVDRGLKSGCFRLSDEPEYIGGIDWYMLEPFDKFK